ncbi:LAC2-like protein [Mya arenaria]|uniref:LAC2-like protein n=1 Tax=Mya arenaria TaxID=6604 RepID=A0ABY7EUZ3_MYAAR|nr:LAC2-like protein [Mya arenaria]
MTCEYNFTIEHYQTLSRACFNCPYDAADCYRPHCIPGDGNVCQGDTVVVNVYNQLGDFEGTTIHWHGILQEGTPHMDGVAMVTQCPIPTHSSFQYKDTSPTPAMTHYDEDLPEHTVVMQDWLDQFASSKFSLHHHSMGPNTPASILINAFGLSKTMDGDHAMDGMDMGNKMTMNNDTDHPMGNMETTPMTTSGMDMHDMGDNSSSKEEDKSFVPHQLFSVTHGKRYRFRLINNGILNCPLKVSVHGHSLRVIATDGNDIEAVDVDSVTLFAGERFDVILSANQTPGNYWMHVVGLGDCVRSMTSQTAIIRYTGQMVMKPLSGDSYADGDRGGKNANPFAFVGDTISVAQMTSAKSAEDVYTSHNVKKFYVQLGYNEVENYRFLDSVHYPLSMMTMMNAGMVHGTHLMALQMNKITYTMPESPVLTQYGELKEDVFCNETSIGKDCTQEFCECVHRLKVAVGDVVELVLISDGKYGMGNHPMHMHGYSFYVLGMERLNDTVDRSLIEELDSRGKLNRNLLYPVQKDTVVVPDGGYTIIRFKADNPGFWLFHCHVDFHMQLGLAMVIQVGESHEMAPPPPNFPRCGSWSFSQAAGISAYQCTNAASAISSRPNGVVMILLYAFAIFRIFVKCL